MAFLQKVDLEKSTDIQVVDLITQSDDSKIQTKINETIRIMKSYMYKYYDVEIIFGQTGENRDIMVLKYLKDIVIYEIRKIRGGGNTEDDIAIANDVAMNWLRDISTGKIEPNLPRKLEDSNADGQTDTAVPFLKLGSRKKVSKGL